MTEIGRSAGSRDIEEDSDAERILVEGATHLQESDFVLAYRDIPALREDRRWGLAPVAASVLAGAYLAVIERSWLGATA